MVDYIAFQTNINGSIIYSTSSCVPIKINSSHYNWYTRFQNPAAGSYSTVPRDACFVIKKGEISHPIHGIRISDDIPRQLSNIVSLSKARRWIEWWEVETPVLSPFVAIKDVPVTRST